MSDVLRVLVIEDEEPARRTIRDLLAERSNVEWVGEAWGPGALDEVRELGPDVVFTDIRMPGMSGFEVLRALESDLGEDVPVVVVMTAFEEHALEAFEVRAVDYLLKPFNDARFFEALDRAVEAVRLRRGTSPADASRPLVRSFAPSGDRRLVIEDAGTTIVLPLSEVTWMEASGPYVVIHAGEDHMVRRSLTSLSTDLADSGFVRVHRSALVNLGAVRTLRPLGHGDAVTLLTDGTSVRVSRARREAFEAALFGDPPGG